MSLCGVVYRPLLLVYTPSLDAAALPSSALEFLAVVRVCLLVSSSCVIVGECILCRYVAFCLCLAVVVARASSCGVVHRALCCFRDVARVLLPN
jgi:hypothetical protein